MKTLMLYTPSETHSCGYLDDQEARSQYVDPRINLNPEELNALNRMGFRRSGRLLYRPECPACRACIPVRLRVSDMKTSRNLKKALNKSRHWQFSVSDPIADQAHYDLYERYIIGRHSDGDMYPPSVQSFQEFLVDSFGTTRYLNAWDKGQLVATMVFDIFDDGLSSVYCFFDPEYHTLSVGTIMIMKLNELTMALGKPFNYLGFSVEGCRKMEYKTRFSPLEGFISGVWQPLTRV